MSVVKKSSGLVQRTQEPLVLCTAGLSDDLTSHSVRSSDINTENGEKSFEPVEVNKAGLRRIKRRDK